MPRPDTDQSTDRTPSIPSFLFSAVEFEALEEAWPEDPAAWRTALAGIIQRATDRATPGEGARA